MTFSPEDTYYLGFDLSTQQLKCLAINQDLKIVHSETVEFDKDLSHFGTRKGVYIKGDRIESPVAMWLEALDLVLTKYQHAKFPLNQVVAMSGSCQQHGCVFWSKEGAASLEQGVANGLATSLVEQLSPEAFARSTAPNWQDHSTGMQCDQMEDTVNGPVGMSNITGSRAHFRFSGPQILKIAQEEPEAYENTDTISLVSNFLSSVLCGKLIALEEADACGMNLYDIKKRKLHTGLLQLIDDTTKNNKSRCVKEKLAGEPIKCEENPVNLGYIGKYFVNKFGFQTKCSIFPFTGDNLATICSLPLQNNDILVSLGTSTTVLLVTDQYHPSPNYHLFIHPTIPNAYMGMICYCNGSLAREKVRDEINKDGSTNWDKFNDAVLDEQLDTSNEVGIYFPLGEIVPSVPAVTKRVLFNKETGEIDHEVEAFVDSSHDAKNIVESQALSCRVRISPLLAADANKATNSNVTSTVSFDHDKDVSLSTYLNKRPKRAFFVGGASKNDAIVKKFAQVLGATDGNYRLDTPNSCALGGCYKALWSDMYDKNKTSSGFDTFLQEVFPWNELERFYDSDTKYWETYNKKIIPLSRLESTL
ncbi:xylulose kinase [Monosporozyma servazzii]